MDINKEIMKEYKWYDHVYFLRLMKLWLGEASKEHLTNGVTMSAEGIAKKMKVMMLLLDRLEKDEYAGHQLFMEGYVDSKLEHWTVSEVACRVYGKSWEDFKGLDGQTITSVSYVPDAETYRKRLALANEHDRMQRMQDKELFAKMFVKHLDSFWD